MGGIRRAAPYFYVRGIITYECNLSKHTPNAFDKSISLRKGLFFGLRFIISVRWGAFFWVALYSAYT